MVLLGSKKKMFIHRLLFPSLYVEQWAAIRCWQLHGGGQKRSADDSALWRSSSSSSSRGGGGWSEPPSPLLPRSTLKPPELLPIYRDFEGETAWKWIWLWYKALWISVKLGLCDAASILARASFHTHTHTHSPGFVVYLIRCSNEWNVVYPLLKRRLVWLRRWKRPRRRGEGAGPTQTRREEI